MRSSILISVVMSLVTVACSTPGGSGSDDDPTADARPDQADFKVLISGSWELKAGQADTYKCVRLTVKEDTYVGAFQAMAPPGTHHTVLGIAPDTDTVPDGIADCKAGTLPHQMLYASGVGTKDLTFDDGIAVKVAAGTRLLLNLHLYNATDDPLPGESGILVKAIAKDQVKNEAEMVFVGPFGFNVPAKTTKRYLGTCAMKADSTLFVLWPHMHQIGRHMKIIYTPVDGSPRVLHDADYAFDDQLYYPMASLLPLRKDDKISAECTFVNDTNLDIGFGDGSDKEMCFAGLYRYPASGAGVFECRAPVEVP